jgi:arylsulfatase A-like enzyme
MEGDDFPGHGGGGRAYPAFRDYLREQGLESDMVDHGDGCVELRGDPDATVDVFLRRRAETLMRGFHQQGDPFCMMLNFWGPHSPYVVPTRHLDRFRGVRFDLWPSFREDLRFKPKIHAAKRSQAGWDWFEKQLRFSRAYASFIDEQAGRLVKWMNGEGLLENTHIVYMADHGDSLGVHGGLCDKSFHCYEETCSIPLVIRPAPAAGLRPPARVDVPVSLVDVYSTMLDWAGVPERLHRRHGRSLAPWLRGETPADWPESVVTESSGIEHCLFTSRMIRKGPWKYVFNCGDRDELYNLETDPAELNNLVFSSGHERVLLDMMDALEKWMLEKKDRLGSQFRALRPEGDPQSAR